MDADKRQQIPNAKLNDYTRHLAYFWLHRRHLTKPLHRKKLKDKKYNKGGH